MRQIGQSLTARPFKRGISNNKFRVAFIAVAVSLLAAPLSWGALSSYNQDFEGLDMADGAALGADGWRIFGNVFDGGDGFKFG